VRSAAAAGAARSTWRGRSLQLFLSGVPVSRWKSGLHLGGDLPPLTAIAASRAFISAMERSISARCSCHCGWSAPQCWQRAAGLISRPHAEH
jgi:hypothetical protein